jgi:copper chaperone CopZ
MKNSFLLVLFLLPAVYSHAQKMSTKIDTIRVHVFGNCEMCKERIEQAAKGPGVKSAIWDIDSKQLTLVYNTNITNPGKVEQRIADAGHDTQKKKAKDNVYSELPECCLYRHGTMEELMQKNTEQADTVSKIAADLLSKDASFASGKQLIKGVVLEADNKGNFHALQGASVIWLGTNHGTITDSSGVFKIAAHAAGQQLVISYTGYKSDTIVIQPAEELKIILASNQ